VWCILINSGFLAHTNITNPLKGKCWELWFPYVNLSISINKDREKERGESLKIVYLLNLRNSNSLIRTNSFRRVSFSQEEGTEIQLACPLPSGSLPHPLRRRL
jgi:hypothetical protein